MATIDTDDASATLEQVATKLAVYEEENQLENIIPKLMDTLINAKFSDGNSFKYTDNEGREKYRVILSGEQRNELAYKLGEALVYHAYVLKYGAAPTNFKGFIGLKSPSGEYIADNLLEMEFDTNLDKLRHFVSSLPKVTPEAMMDKFNEMIEKQKQKIEGAILNPLAKDKYVIPIKSFLKDKVLPKYGDQLNNDEMKKEIDETYDIRGLLGMYKKFAAPLYKPPKDKAA